MVVGGLGILTAAERRVWHLETRGANGRLLDMGSAVPLLLERVDRQGDDWSPVDPPEINYYLLTCWLAWASGRPYGRTGERGSLRHKVVLALQPHPTGRWYEPVGSRPRARLRVHY